MHTLLVARIAIASVWMYQGLWCKLLGQAPRHQEIVETTPFLRSTSARRALVAVGSFECLLSVWVLCGVWARTAAAAQTLLLVGMNTIALWRARGLISDPAGMLLQNFALLVLAWIAAGPLGCYAEGI